MHQRTVCTLLLDPPRRSWTSPQQKLRVRSWTRKMAEAMGSIGTSSASCPLMFDADSVSKQYSRGGEIMNLSKRAIAECLGTFWLVFGGCGSAVLAAAFPHLGIGFYGVALAFGLTGLTM